MAAESLHTVTFPWTVYLKHISYKLMHLFVYRDKTILSNSFVLDRKHLEKWLIV